MSVMCPSKRILAILNYIQSWFTKIKSLFQGRDWNLMLYAEHNLIPELNLSQSPSYRRDSTPVLDLTSFAAQLESNSFAHSINSSSWINPT